MGPSRASEGRVRSMRVAMMLAPLVVLAACGSDSARTEGPSSTAPVTSSARPTTRPPGPSLTPPTTPTTSVGSTSRPTTSAPKAGAPLAGLVVVIDPGHNGRNGSDPAAINRLVDAGGFTKPCNTTGTAGADGYSEAQFNWDTALVVADAISKAGGRAVLTRTSNDGVGPCVDERGLTSGRVGADVMVSIHADGSTGAGHHGFHVIHPGGLEGYTDGTAADSERLAIHFRDELVSAGWSTSNYLGSNGLDERDDLGTLNRSSVPSVMVESGNMRNAADLRFLESADSKSQMAAAVVGALTRFRSGA